MVKTATELSRSSVKECFTVKALFFLGKFICIVEFNQPDIM